MAMMFWGLKDEETKQLANVLRRIGDEFKHFDLYAIVTPHNIRISDHIGIIFAEKLISWLGFAGVKFSAEYKTERWLAEG